ncbi:MAG: PQQ-binding-like beta-propeller repeat protein, partial [Clostridia bacterium]|nr:PQQ-binding-like beta-propeller repeat protein [Clostridia bacterium]
ELRDEYEFITNDLKALGEKKKIVIFRHNRYTEGTDFVVNFEDCTYNLPEMGLIAWIQGHDHSNFLMKKNKVLHMCSSRPDSGGIDNTAGSVRRVFIDEEKITTDIQFNLLPHTEKAAPIWLTKLDGYVEYASLIERGNKLFCATIDDGYPKKCGVYGIDKESGEILWFFPTQNSIKNDICANETQVFAQDCEGTVYSICAESGKLLWKFEDCQGEKYFHRCSVATNGETVYAGNGRKLFFLRSSDGKKICEIDPQKRGDHAPSKHVFSDDKEIIFCNAQWLRLAAVNAKSGETLWELKSQKAEIGNPGAFWYRTNTPLYHDGKIYAFGFSHGAIADAKTGEILLHKAIPHKTEVVGSAAISDGILYLPTATQGVVALDPETLDELWRYPVDNGLVFSSSYIVGSKQTVEAPVQIIDDQIVFAANDGFVYFYDKKEPVLKKKIPLHFASITAPIIKKDHLYAVTFDGTVGKYKI